MRRQVSDQDNLTELEQAVSDGNIEKISQLLNKKIEFFSCDWERQPDVRKAVKITILNDKADVMALFLYRRYGLNNVIDIDKHKQLYLASFAAMHGKLDVLKLLVDRGADIDNNRELRKLQEERLEFPFNEVLAEAIENKHINVVEYLVSKGSNVNDVYRKRRQTFIGRASWDGFFEIAKVLGDAGANVKRAITLNFACFKKSAESFLGEYRQSLLFLLDYAIGVDFLEEYNFELHTLSDKLGFVHGIDVTGMSFVGTSYGGVPITRKLLAKSGAVNSKLAIVTLHDLEKIEAPRKENLMGRLQRFFQEHGKHIDENGIINAVPMNYALLQNDMNIVSLRLLSGIMADIDQDFLSGMKISPLELATMRGSEEAVKLFLQTSLSPESIATARSTAQQYNHHRITALLQPLVDPNTRDSIGQTLLHKAVEAGDLGKVKLLVTRGAKIDILDSAHKTPVDLALEYSYRAHLKMYSEDHFEILRFFTAMAMDFPRLLSAAVRNDDLRTTELLLSAYDKKNITKQVRDVYGKVLSTYSCPWYADLIYEALNCEDPRPMATLLKKHGADFSYQAEEEGRRVSPLLMVYIARRFPLFTLESDQRYEGFDGKKILKFLLLNGANPRSTDDEGKIVFHELVKKYFLESAYDILLAHGASVTAESTRGEQAIHLAAACGNVKAITWLVAKGANVNARMKNGITALHLAARYARYGSMLELIRLGASLSALCNHEKTALQYAKEALAADLNHLDSINKTLGAGTHRWKTPLLLAAAMNEEMMTLFLLESGADHKAQDEQGLTALMHVVANKNVKLLEAFIRVGADFEVKDWRGRTALLHAKERMILKRMIAVSNINVISTEGLTVLHIVIQERYTELFESLFEKGLGKEVINSKSSEHDGTTPLYRAVQSAMGLYYLDDSLKKRLKYTAWKDLIEKLLQAGADPSISCQYSTAIEISRGELKEILLRCNTRTMPISPGKLEEEPAPTIQPARVRIKPKEKKSLFLSPEEAKEILENRTHSYEPMELESPEKHSFPHF